MELKIQCNCGTKFKFEFEPVDGRVPFQVICPTCKADATEFANTWVAQQLGIPETVAADPAPAAPPPTEPGRPKLSIRGGSHAPASAPPAAEDEGAVAPPVVAPSPRPTFVPNSGAYSNLTPPDQGLTPHFFYGVAGAVGGAALGCAIWYLIFHFSGLNFRLFALLVGAGGGFGARLASRDEGSSQLGMITCVIVLCGIVFTAYNIGKESIHDALGGGLVRGVYKEELKYAKRAVKAVPTGSDSEIRDFLATEEASSAGKKNAALISTHEIRIFRDVRLDHYKALASGQVTEHDYPKSLARLGFDERVANAKYALETMPHENEKEIRDYLAAEAVDPGEQPNPQAVSADEVTSFKNETLPEFKKLASGETKYVEPPDIFEKSQKKLDKVEEENGWMRVIYFFAGWGIGGVFLMFGTLGVAYKTCTHASG